MKELALEKTRLDNRYDILELLGRGSYAEIFVARDNHAAPDSPHKQVVIKALNVFLQEDPDADLERTLIENFQNEALALDRVRHPNVISRLGHGTARDLRNTIFHYLVLEYLPGGDLSQLCKREPLALETTLFYLEQVCAGLAHAHANHVIHRDIKPHNLLLTADQRTVKIADFGVAKIESSDSPITRVGTNIYAAPEHSPFNLANDNASNAGMVLTPAADVYSLAKTVYVLLTGESPRKFVNAPLTSFPPQIAEKAWANDVLRTLEHATQTDFKQRSQTVIEFWQEITNAIASAAKTEEATRVIERAAAAVVPRPTGSLAGFDAQAPAMPSFSSLPNVQTLPQTTEKLLERPRVVVELNRAQPNQPPALIKNLPAAAPPINDSSQARNNAVNVNRAPIQAQPANLEPKRIPQKSKLALKFNAFLKRVALRLAVVLIILGVFVGILGQTYNYFQTNGYFPTGFPSLFARKGVASTDANLRKTPEFVDDNIINLVTKDSELKILDEEGNWYKVEVVRQDQPDRAKSNETHGWMSKKVIDVQ